MSMEKTATAINSNDPFGFIACFFNAVINKNRHQRDDRKLSFLEWWNSGRF